MANSDINDKLRNKMKNSNITVGTVPKPNTKIVERCKINIPNAQ
jgi:hypothetical protein